MELRNELTRPDKDRELIQSSRQQSLTGPLALAVQSVQPKGIIECTVVVSSDETRPTHHGSHIVQSTFANQLPDVMTLTTSN